MVKSRSNDSHAHPSVRQSVPQPAKEFLEPADSFDLGDDASSAEAAAGEWLGRKAAAKSRKKKSLKEKTARGSAATAATKEPAPAQKVPVAQETPFSPSVAESGRAGASASSGADAPSNSALDETCSPDAGSSSRNRPSRRGAVAKPHSSAHRNRILKIVAVCFAAVLVACAAVAAFWAWDTWLRFDDSADIQGEWLTANGTALVVIDAEAIHMPDSVDFKYTLDTKSKTISYTFVDLTGGGSYEFSRDRATLTITESDGSQTVFQKYSDSTDGEPRVLSADEAAALMNAGQGQEGNAGQGQEGATAQNSGDSSEASGEASAEASGEAAGDSAAQTETTDESASSASSAPALDEEESAKIAEALNSSSGDLSPGSNAVQPGAMGAAAGA
ncbi:hypothetical protein [uncultured Ellagibacter sp.]|uniref:hypothetical protein n=1 Tax=uncultured Ellagibacter sp. TaxID=2137580 RepID=UPI002611ED23|nr:hypothetical protein [uncultured Ellagibacter sp.]